MTASSIEAWREKDNTPILYRPPESEIEPLLRLKQDADYLIEQLSLDLTRDILKGKTKPLMVKGLIS